MHPYHSRLHRKPLRDAISHDDTALKLFVEWFCDVYYVIMYSIGMQYLPKGASVDTVNTFPKSTKLKGEGCVPFQALFNYNFQCEDLVHTPSSLPVFCSCPSLVSMVVWYTWMLLTWHNLGCLPHRYHWLRRWLGPAEIYDYFLGLWGSSLGDSSCDSPSLEAFVRSLYSRYCSFLMHATIAKI